MDEKGYPKNKKEREKKKKERRNREKAKHLIHTSCGKYPVNATFHSSNGVLNKKVVEFQINSVLFMGSAEQHVNLTLQK